MTGPVRLKYILNESQLTEEIDDVANFARAPDVIARLDSRVAASVAVSAAATAATVKTATTAAAATKGMGFAIGVKSLGLLVAATTVVGGMTYAVLSSEDPGVTQLRTNALTEPVVKKPGVTQDDIKESLAPLSPRPAEDRISSGKAAARVSSSHPLPTPLAFKTASNNMDSVRTTNNRHPKNRAVRNTATRGKNPLGAQTSSEKIAIAPFEEGVSETPLRGSSSQMSQQVTAFTTARNLFENGDYIATSIALKRFLSTWSSSHLAPDVLLLSAHAAFKRSQFATAERYATAVIEGKASQSLEKSARLLRAKSRAMQGDCTLGLSDLRTADLAIPPLIKENCISNGSGTE